MPKVGRLAALATLLSGWLMLGLAPSIALADCSGGGYVRHLEDAQGTAFIGTFEGKRMELTPQGNRDRFYHWRIDRTVAGSKLPREFSFDGFSCNPPSFTRGARYLVSYNSGMPWASIQTFNTIAYDLPGDGRAMLVGFDVSTSEYPAIFQVHTLRDALALLVRTLPPTDATATEAPSIVPFGGVLLSLPLTVLVLAAWHRRLRPDCVRQVDRPRIARHATAARVFAPWGWPLGLTLPMDDGQAPVVVPTTRK